MENSSSYKKDVFQVLSQSTKILKGKWGELIGASAISVFILVALFMFPVAGPFASFFASGFVCLGLTGYALSIIRGKESSWESIFIAFKRCISSFVLKLVKCLYIFLWGLLLIIPGVIACLNYSFAMPILNDNKNYSAKQSLDESKKLVVGYRDVLLALHITFLALGLLIFVGCLMVPVIISFFVSMKLWMILVVAIVITLCVYVVFLLPYSQICIASVYLDAKKFHEINNSKKVVKRAKTKSIEKVEEKQ